MMPTQKPTLRCEYVNEFGDATRFETSMNMMTNSDEMLEAVRRFLLACGWAEKSWEQTIKEYADEYYQQEKQQCQDLPF